MQRVILFRGKRIDNGKWAYGYHLFDCQITSKAFIIDLNFLKKIEVDFDTIGQTLNKNSTTHKSVFEGDVRREEIEEEGGDRRYLYICTYIKEWECFAWLSPTELHDYKANGIVSLDHSMRSTFLMDDKKEIVICGNIHDHPHYLLQEHEEPSERFDKVMKDGFGAHGVEIEGNDEFS